MDEKVKVEFEAVTEAFVSHVAQIREILQGLTSPLRALRSNLGELAEAFAAAFAIEKISEFVHSMAELGAGIEHMSERLGIGVEELQNFTFAAGEVGIGAQEAGFALQRLATHLASAADSAGGAAAAAFDKLGISIKNTDGSLISQSEVLNKLADAFHTMPDGVEKTNLAMQIMGRTGAQMIPFLNLGAEGFDEARKRAEELGLVLSHETVKGMDETSTQTFILHQAWTKLSALAFDQVKPAIDAIIESLIRTSAHLIQGVEDFNKWADASNRAAAIATQHETEEAIKHQEAAVRAAAKAYEDATVITKFYYALQLTQEMALLAAMRQRQELVEELAKESGRKSSSAAEKDTGALPTTFTELQKELKKQLDEFGITNQGKLAYERDFWTNTLELTTVGNAALIEARRELNSTLRTINDKERSDASSVSASGFSAEQARNAAKIADMRSTAALDFELKKTTEAQKVLAERRADEEEYRLAVDIAKRKGNVEIAKARESGLGGDVEKAEAAKMAALAKLESDYNSKRSKSNEEYNKSVFDANQKIIDQADTLSKEEIAIKFATQKTLIESEASTNKITQDQKFAALLATSEAEEKAEVGRINARLAAGGLDVAATRRLEDEKTLAHKHGEEERTKITADQAQERFNVEKADNNRAVSTTQTILDIRMQNERDALDAGVAAEVISTNQKIAEMRRLTAADFDNKIILLRNQRELNTTLAADKKEIDTKIEILEEQKNSALLSLDRQAAAEYSKVWTDVANVITTSMDTMLQGVLQGTQTFSNAMKQFWNNMVIAAIEALAKIAVQYAAHKAAMLVLEHTNLLQFLHIMTEKQVAETVAISHGTTVHAAGEIAKTATTETGVATRAGVEGSESIGFLARVGQMIAGWLGFETDKTAATVVGEGARLAVGKAAAMANVATGFAMIQIEAAVAAAAAFADMLMLGPEMLGGPAEGAAAAAYAFTMGFATGLGAAFPALAAEEGALIPSGVSPMVRLHQNEIALPASLSGGLQSMIASHMASASAGGGGGQQTINVHVNQSNASPSDIAYAVAKAARDFHPATRALRR